jgi:hypothetical protein
MYLSVKIMKHKFRQFQLFILISLLFLPSSAIYACRYNVRDVAFVYFGQNPYRLYGFVNQDTPAEVKTTFEQIAYAALLETNVIFELVDVTAQPDHQALDYLKKMSIDSFPAAVLVSLDNRPMQISIAPGQESFKENLWTAIGNIVDSPKRKEIVQHVIDAYGIVLLIQGRDTQQNQLARATADAALAQITSSLPLMPKAIKAPPVLLTLGPETFEQERILLWSLGITDKKLAETHIAVLHGRGRLIGPIVSGDEINPDLIIRILSVIGADCECGLDRRWMQGPLIPLRWDEKIQARLVNTLGFDPESPMVKNEVSGILRRGPAGLNPFGGFPGADSGTAPPLPPANPFGYREIEVVFENDNNLPTGAAVDPNFDKPVEIPVGDINKPTNTPTQTAIKPISPGEAETQNDTSTELAYSTSLWILGGMFLLILVGAVFILLRARGRSM